MSICVPDLKRDLLSSESLPGTMLSARDVSQLLFSRSLHLDGEREISRPFANWEMGGMTQESTGATGKPRADSCPVRGWGGGVPPEEEVSKG